MASIELFRLLIASTTLAMVLNLLWKSEWGEEKIERYNSDKLLTAHFISDDFLSTQSILVRYLVWIDTGLLKSIGLVINGVLVLQNL